MNIKIIERSELVITGYVVETSYENCGKDLSELWDNFKGRKIYDSKKDLYGLMWYTKSHNYCYLLGIEYDSKETGEETVFIKTIPPARYAVISISDKMSVVEAWTLFFEKVLPEAGYSPDSDHGLYFEYYPDKDSKYCELWTPIKEPR